MPRAVFPSDPRQGFRQNSRHGAPGQPGQPEGAFHGGVGILRQEDVELAQDAEERVGPRIVAYAVAERVAYTRSHLRALQGKNLNGYSPQTKYDVRNITDKLDAVGNTTAAIELNLRFGSRRLTTNAQR